MNPQKRSRFWKSKRVFFVTPQVLEKDIQSGICLVKQLVCLVIDEAHRATGNYSYCVAVRELMSVPVQLRILALTATPGSKQQAVQKVIDNLCISTLEYRNESDRDVSQYVHDRKLELVQVAMGEDAVGINNLLLDVVRPYVSRLCGFGVLPTRDYATLSPCELLNSRDKFRQAPPSSLPQAKYGEVEGYFGVLITLYHLRKLLSSHGIRPAYEMLEEKLNQGSFARLMSKNENIWKAKLLMQQSLSLGAPNPKLVKMIDVLLDHFKTKDPKDSRVIIFSNFRGSVRDIMETLSSLGDIIKATEFIGQSSGKTLKGQSQKMQQAVLQKFRNGGYNVIVATSIGEEGLDIMEVDLVICFDANVSPLRMIQRMGRTGRNHDGRVVILACEGSELKGYLRKQASSKAVRKHMHNGGIKSFDFHASPRMVPHICKPEVQFVELSIEQFIPRGKKKNDITHGSPVLKRLSDGEEDLIVRYFRLPKENIWKPSLIAFPSFQAFPSRVHTVKHSLRTTSMLIETMQRLQGLSFSNVKSCCSIKVETSSPPSLPDVSIARDNIEQDTSDVHEAIHNLPSVLFQAKGSDASTTVREISESKYAFYVPDATIQKPPVHCFLFGGDFVTVNALGSVCLGSVPSLPHKGSVISEPIMKETNEDLRNTKYESSNSKASTVNYGMLLVHCKDAAEVAAFTQLGSVDNDGSVAPHSPIHVVRKEQKSENSLLRTPIPEGKLAHAGEFAAETPGHTENITPTSLAVNSVTFKETDLSPRLNHFIEEGIVPESPIYCSSKIENNICATFKPECDLTNVHGRKTHNDASTSSAMLLSTSGKNGSHVLSHVSTNIHKVSSLSSAKVLLDNGKQGNMQDNAGETDKKGNVSVSLSNEVVHTPLVNQMSNSSDNWQLTSGEVSESISQAPKYKRLRKYGDMIKKTPCMTLKGKISCIAEEQGVPSMTNQMDGNKGKTKKAKKDFNSFIDEEAEVSDDAEVSEDEENESADEYDDSFIDDRVNPTGAITQGASKGGDMMAFYRRSLFTQSPMEVLPAHLADSYDSASLRTIESGSCSLEKTYSHLQTPQSGPQSVKHPSASYSITCRQYSEQASSIMMPGEANCSGMECPSKLESRKRKLSFQNAGSSPVIVIGQEENFGTASLQCRPGVTRSDGNLFDDDDFYQSLDLDAVEAQATELLRYKSGILIDRTSTSFHNHKVQIKKDPVVNIVSSPSFDLGV